MEAKFTKGEWKFITTPGYHEPKSSTLEIHSDESKGWICKIQNNGLIGEQEGVANAKLIAAAPLMYEALKKIDWANGVPPEKWDSETYDACQEVKNALKKATE